MTIPDPAHSLTEHRFVTAGLSSSLQLLVAVHTERGDNTRIISARRANKKERRHYEEAKP